MDDYDLNEILEELTKYGMTKNQALVYVTLVSIGKASVKRISQVSGIRREEVYRLLPELEKIGLIERILGKPNKFRAIPPEKGISILISRLKEEFNQKMENLLRKKDELSMLLSKIAATKHLIHEDTKVSEFVLIYNFKNTLQKAIEMIEKAEKEILAIIPEEDLFYLANLGLLKEFVKLLKKKSIKSKVIIFLGKFKDSTYNLLKKKLSNLGKNVKVKVSEKVVLSLFISDNNEALISIPERSGRSVHPDLWTDNREYVKKMRLLFEDHWLNSIDAQIWIERFEGKAPQRGTEVIRWERLKYHVPILKDRIRNAEKEILFLLNYEGALLVREIGLCEILHKKSGKIKLKGVLPLSEKDKMVAFLGKFKLKKVNIRFFDFIGPTLLVIVDGRELVMCAPFKSDRIIIWSNTKYMIEPFRTYFNEIWKKALPKTSTKIFS